MSKSFSLLLVAAFIRQQLAMPNIGIIGAGIGGTSAAYFLEELFGPSNINITIFEENKIGGRLQTLKFLDNYYEQGGSVIHPRNKYMVEFAKKLGLEHRSSDEKDSEYVLWDGKEIVFQSSNWLVINIARLLYRYGWDAVKIDPYITNMLDKFDRIYQLQTDTHSYELVESLLHAMSPDFVNMTKMTTADGFKADGFGDRIIDELILAVTRVNYCQSTEIQHFVGSVSISGAAPNLWSVKGGNQLIPEKLIDITKAKVVKHKVTEIELLQNGQYLVKHVGKDETNLSDTFDILVIAAPLTSDTSNIAFVQFPNKFSFPGIYHTTVATFVHGIINKEYFTIGNEEHLEAVFTVNNNLYFTALAKNVPVDFNNNSESVYKIFSNRELTDNQLKELFSEIKEKNVKVWRAYPEYSSNSQLGRFVLHNHLYHINAIEWAASAMEMSCIGAKNTALLAYQRWNRVKRSRSTDSEEGTSKKQKKLEL